MVLKCDLPTFASKAITPVIRANTDMLHCLGLSGLYSQVGPSTTARAFAFDGLVGLKAGLGVRPCEFHWAALLLGESKYCYNSHAAIHCAI